MNKEKISFEKEVAETLGINTAIILELYKSLNFKSHLPKDKLLELIQSECPFMDRKEIETSFEKLLKVKLIKAAPGNANKNSKNTFNIKEPKKLAVINPIKTRRVTSIMSPRPGTSLGK